MGGVVATQKLVTERFSFSKTQLVCWFVLQGIRSADTSWFLEQEWPLIKAQKSFVFQHVLERQGGYIFLDKCGSQKNLKKKSGLSVWKFPIKNNCHNSRKLRLL